MSVTYRALVVEETPDGVFKRHLTNKTLDEVPDNHLLIKVAYTSLNYKDALSATGNKGVTRTYPHVPGIDAAGTVTQSNSDAFKKDDQVIVTGYDLGMNTDGAFAEYICVPSDWAVPCPEALSLKVSMIYGTAGFTAALCVQKLLQHGLEPGQGQVLVTGASGGVGSIAVGVLAKLGFEVAAVTGKAQQASYLTELGTKEIIDRKDLSEPTPKPMLKGRWTAVVDTVGGNILTNAIKSCQYGAVITACGNAASPELPLTVFPFILRGVSLLGVDSVNCSTMDRIMIWQNLAENWAVDGLEKVFTEISLDGLDPYIDKILNGQVSGRVLIKVS